MAVKIGLLCLILEYESHPILQYICFIHFNNTQSYLTRSLSRNLRRQSPLFACMCVTEASHIDTWVWVYSMTWTHEMGQPGNTFHYILIWKNSELVESVNGYFITIEINLRVQSCNEYPIEYKKSNCSIK